nr:dna-directed rna polymerase iii subunit 1 [Quercus suber]
MNVQAQAQAQDIVFTKQPYIEDVGPRKIQSMNFSTLSESEISRIAEVQVYKGQYYDAARIPIEGGLLDPRMVNRIINKLKRYVDVFSSVWR